MGRGPLRRFFWRMVDALDYFLTLASLRIHDALAGPLPETEAERRREQDRERLERAFPEIERWGVTRRVLTRRPAFRDLQPSTRLTERATQSTVTDD